MKYRVLVVDDSSFFQKRVREMLEQSPQLSVVGCAANGQQAIEMAKQLKPDAITMDVEMPILDGISAVKGIMASAPCAILMFSSLTHEGAHATLSALEAGALDFLPKKFEDVFRNPEQAATQLQQKILALVQAPQTLTRLRKPSAFVAPKRMQSAALDDVKRTEPSTLSNSTETIRSLNRGVPQPSLGASNCSLLVLGTSTGGPAALHQILASLPAQISVPILIVQHMPSSFTGAFAQRLDTCSALSVKEAEQGDVLKPGHAFLAPGGFQMGLAKQGAQTVIRILPGDERLTYKPSVDVTFGYAAKCYGAGVLGIVMTGMGSDGREGARLIRQANGRIWTQSEQSCVVYGMPQAVDKAELSQGSYELSQLSDAIVKVCQ